MKRNLAAFALTSVAAISTLLPLAVPAQAQDDKKPDSRQNNKNTVRNVGYGLGGAALLQLLRGRGTEALILGAGAAYAGKKAQDQQKAQDKDDREKVTARQSSRNNRPGFYNVAPSAPVGVTVDDDRVAFNDQGPEVVGGRVYVPLRGVLEKMGADVKWDANARTLTAQKGDRVVRLPAGGQATVNGQPVALDAPAFISDGRTMVPLRFMAEAFNADVNYDSNSRQVSIQTQGKNSASGA